MLVFLPLTSVAEPIVPVVVVPAVVLDNHTLGNYCVCSSQAVTLEGMKLATEVLYKKGHDYRFFCHGPEQTEKGCHNYRVRFLCGQPGR